jgi:hypothetical protein
LARIGIRARLVELEFGTWIRNFLEKKLHGLARHALSFWFGQIQSAAAIQIIASPENPWSYRVVPAEIENGWKRLNALVDEKAIAAQAREVSRIYRETELRSVLWASHQPFALSQKVKSYTPIQGWMWTGGLEYLELKE